MLHPIARHSILLLLLGIGLTLLGCSSAEEERRDDGQEFIGAPPTEDEDPFFRHALPSEAVPAEQSGQIGAAEPEEDEPEEDEPEEVEPVEDEPDEVEPDEITEQELTEGYSCFSCIRICPVDSRGEALCGDGDKDLICGWGSAPSQQAAQSEAHAQCEGSLSMAREMPTYTSIGGECPPATCR